MIVYWQLILVTVCLYRFYQALDTLSFSTIFYKLLLNNIYACRFWIVKHQLVFNSKLIQQRMISFSAESYGEYYDIYHGTTYIYS